MNHAPHGVATLAEEPRPLKKLSTEEPLTENWAIFTLTAEGAIQTWNQGAEQLTGYPLEEVIGRHVGMLSPETERLGQVAQKDLERALREERCLSERWTQRKDGTRFLATSMVSSLRDASGEFIGFSHMLKDNSERRRAQETLRKTREELERRVIERTLELSKTVDLLEQQLIEREHLESALLEATENERERLGQDLHDGVCQQLTGTAMMARLLSNALQKRDAPEAPQAGQIVELVRSAVDQARDLAKGLHPVSLHSPKGLVAGLQELVDRASPQLPCQLDTPEKVELPPTVALHLYRIAQEAIQNSIKHANAKHLQLTLRAEPDELVLAVCDDGCGLPCENDAHGMGLLNLQYRARAIGARLQLQSASDKGTTVLCRVPTSSIAKFADSRL